MLSKKTIELLEKYGFKPRTMDEDEIEDALDMIKALTEEEGLEWLKWPMRKKTL